MLIVLCLTTEAVTAALSIINYYSEVFIAEETLINYETHLVTFFVLFSLYGNIQYHIVSIYSYFENAKFTFQNFFLRIKFTEV